MRSVLYVLAALLLLTTGAEAQEKDPCTWQSLKFVVYDPPKTVATQLDAAYAELRGNERFMSCRGNSAAMASPQAFAQAFYQANPGVSGRWLVVGQDTAYRLPAFEAPRAVVERRPGTTAATTRTEPRRPAPTQRVQPRVGSLAPKSHIYLPPREKPEPPLSKQEVAIITLESKIVTVRSELDRALSELEELRTSRTPSSNVATKADFRTLQSDLAGLRNRVDDIESQANQSGWTSDVTELRQDLATIQAAVDKLSEGRDRSETTHATTSERAPASAASSGTTIPWRDWAILAGIYLVLTCLALFARRTWAKRRKRTRDDGDVYVAREREESPQREDAAARAAPRARFDPSNLKAAQMRRFKTARRDSFDYWFGKRRFSLPFRVSKVGKSNRAEFTDDEVRRAVQRAAHGRDPRPDELKSVMARLIQSGWNPPAEREVL